MEPTVTMAQLEQRVVTEIRDSGQTFLTSEVAEAVTRAIDDDAVTSIIEVQIPITGARQYQLNGSYTTVFNAAIDVNGDGFPEMDFPGDAYDVVNGQFIITPPWMNIQGTIYVQVGKKWVTSDSIPYHFSNFIIEYSISMLTELLQNTYESRFLNNDVTMADLVNRGSEATQKLAMLRKQLRNYKPIRL